MNTPYLKSSLIKYLISLLLQKCNIESLNVMLSEGLISKKPLKLIYELMKVQQNEG